MPSEKTPGNDAKKLLSYLSPRIRQACERLDEGSWSLIEEIRLRAGKPLQVEAGCSGFITASGEFTGAPDNALWIEEDDLQRTLQLMGGNSLYTLEEEMKEGFITLPGGHRVGLSGECLTAEGRLLRIRRVTGMNIRVARQLVGCALQLLSSLTEEGRPLRTLIISPPQAGKTTLLRDIIRCYSNGEGIPFPVKIGLVDERNEISGSYQGVPQLDVGLRTDVLSGCPKGEGIFLLLRSMGPQVIATDEIGKIEDVESIEGILNAGVGFISTAHARGTDDLILRPGLRRIWRLGMVERVVVLSRRFGPGTLEEIWNVRTKSLLSKNPVRLEAVGG